QLSEYFTTGGGRELFGAQQPIALAAVDSLERVGAEVAGRLRPGGHGTEKDEQDLRGGARRHPVVGSHLGRGGVLSSNWKVLSITESSITGTVASVQRSVNGLTNRLGYLNEGLSKRVLWQGELAARDLTPVLLAGADATLDSALGGQEGRLFDA